MPPKHTKQRRSTNTQYKIPATFAHDIENAEGWNAIVEFLCDFFDLPDLTTRSGLKKAHARFNEISKKLDAAYTKGNDNEKIMGGIVGIWAKMSADALLRDKLFKAGLVSKMMPLLDIPSTRHIGLQALSTVTHHGGVAARQEIAKQTPVLLRLMEEFPDDDKIAELAIVVMCHAIGAVVDISDEVPDPKLLETLDMRTVLKMTIDNFRKPNASAFLMSHGLGLLTGSTLHCYKECKALPPVSSFLVACMRSEEITTRCNVLAGILRLNLAESEPDMRYYDPRLLMEAVQRRFPQELVDVMVEYGFERCDTTLTLRSSNEFQKAMQACLHDKDLYKLGKKTAELIVRTEFAIVNGMYQAVNERTGQLEVVDVGLPFKMWADSLSHCARAVRAKGDKSDLDDADVLEIKWYIIKQRIPDAIKVANKALERNPQLAYAYYAIGLGSDSENGLRAVKKGLKAKQITPFVRNYMLWRAVEHAGNLGVSRLQEATAGDRDYNEGMAFLMSSCEDAKRFIAEAPPDTRNMSAILNWYVICSIATRGPELSPDLRELNDAFKKIALADKMQTFIGLPPKNTQIRLTRELIVKQWPMAVKSWGEVIARVDKMDLTSESAHRLPTPAKAEDDLATWLENMNVEDAPEEGGHRAHPKIMPTAVELYRCSYCGNPSAILKKCGGCGKMRYCDSGCQKLHWSDHKRTCKGSD
ncbi:uncharacterized protein B0H18DRAFT_331328 [Fomitopsis serialis]|uniref:uncharacterized protein n=1 Tax=Fomitopsis serialis TaxID=139415 RepID=UPI002007AE9B|nr:uncharacterized protein B0H18DRAFT_331328 [Neoantrodia serialis]KAH9926735.1 hypothetical protein B0H18DRAFT_331328 [Neoantrodia serialis]